MDDMLPPAAPDRRVLEELISTEEGYIGDVRFLINVYINILASLPTLPAGLRSSINRNLTDIVELHDEILGELHRVVPYSEYTQVDFPSKALSSNFHGHRRWRSLGTVPEDKNSSMTWLRDVPGMTTDPRVAAEVARIFSSKMNRFFIYEEYGAKYELMIKDVAAAHRTMPRWDSYQKGLEALAASLGSANSRTDRSKKSLTIGDLLMKPIQRVCKYPLLFAELLKYTPVVDCPQSHMDIENALVRLREATAEINRATDDTRIKAVLEKTWILQDRLIFANQSFDAASKNRIRSFGHVQLCGALHVCWQSKSGITGQYMACIALHDIKVEEVDNGRGLQCHTAPYSWKHEWRSRLVSQTVQDNQERAQAALFTSLSLNIKSMGIVFGKPGTVARRISIHRATTVGPKTPLCQVILKNTSVIKDAPTPSTAAQINRSQSVLVGAGRVPVLAPSRSERARLEALLSDVWTRDILPFPGITARSRSEHLVRAGASSVMRKLSVASIASSFTKRSTSAASLQGAALAAGNADGQGPELIGSTATVNRSLLSAIPDENERRSRDTSIGTGISDTSRSGSSAGSTTSLGSGLMMPSAKMRPPPSVLRSVSDNSGHSSRENAASGKRASFTPPVSQVVGSENASEMGEEEVHRKKKVKASVSSASSLKSRKMSSRWATRVGGLHRETVVQGIRNIFRLPHGLILSMRDDVTERSDLHFLGKLRSLVLTTKQERIEALPNLINFP
ncbi:hypothetical protein P8C59_007214 [Phyllachora maydis]|uniref:DH domain-containing protein n=1 Tax=Phyllachora maydis TaxID=1825666 RepID=A0AAD9ME03_9PEZI|nr:hypothetical protein P8C59_007214 [Phyllachora maydis]